MSFDPIEMVQIQERHAEVVRRFHLLSADVLPASQQERVEGWQALLEEAEDRLNRPLKIAFLATMGRGKSTLISVVSGLHLKIEGSPQEWSVLPVGNGGTTLGEVHVVFEDRTDIHLEITPIPRDALLQELRLFSQDLHRSVHGGVRVPVTAGEELYDLLRAWLVPGSDNPKRALEERARGMSEAELTEALSTVLNEPGRCDPFGATYWNTLEGKTQLQDALRRIMDGELDEAPAPLTTTLHVPRVAHLPVNVNLIDTRGLDPSASDLLVEARPDIQRLFSDPDVLFVICTEFEVPPERSAVELLRALTRANEAVGSDIETTRLVIIDRREGRKKPRERDDKIEVCRDRLAKLDPPIVLPQPNVLAIDARKEGEAISDLIRLMVEEERQARAQSWVQDLESAEAALLTFSDQEQANRLREIDRKLWWAWEAGTSSIPVAAIGPLQSLARAIQVREPWIEHWSHLHAAVRRRGRYIKLDLVDLAARQTMGPRTRSVQAGLREIDRCRLTGWFRLEFPAEMAHFQMRRVQMEQAAVRELQEGIKGWATIVGDYFASEPATDMWTDCYLRWGQGPGYVRDVANRIERESPPAEHQFTLPIAQRTAESRFHERPSPFSISQVKASNFRAVTNSRHDLGTTVLFVGDNAEGKTTWLEAIATALRPMVTFLGGESPPSDVKLDIRTLIRRVGDREVAEPQTPMAIEVSAEVEGRHLTWQTGVDEPAAPESVIDVEALRVVAAEIGQDVRAHHVRPLPLMAYYGTGRLWPVDQEPDIRPQSPTSRLEGYNGCLSAKASHRLLLNGMWWASFVASHEGKSQSGLLAVKNAVITMVKGATDFLYRPSLNDLCLAMGPDKLVPFRQLSDGYRNIVAMTADIAWRSHLLNPQFYAAAPRLTEGVVLIDEVDLHLHPLWQRHVLADLRRAFPRLQFICTTHSPFIIQSLEPGQLVNLDPDADPTEEYADESPEDIAENVMGVPLPQRSWRREQTAIVAVRYFDLLDKLPDADQTEIGRLKAELDFLLAPYNENQAFVAFLERKRAIAERHRE